MSLTPRSLWASLRPLLKSPAANIAVAPVTKRHASLMKINSKTTRPKLFHSPRTTPARRIKVQPPAQAPPKDVLTLLATSQLSILDPTGTRQKLFSRHNPDAIRVGDILQVRRKNAEPFAGVLMNIRRRGVDTGFLLRNQVTRVGVEIWFKLYSPLIEGIDVVQRKGKRSRRAKLYYLRKPGHDLGSVQGVVSQYMRQRALLRGGKKETKGGRK
ncbi:hypothetical protein RUND412_003184 [Rhizina undulata]